MGEALQKLGKKAEKLGKSKISILRLIYENPHVTTTIMAKEIGISTTAIDNNIRQMRDIFIKHVGPSNGGHWEIIEEE